MTLADQLCSYCFAPAEAWDHVQARSRGGADDASNLVPACQPCNSRKAADTLLGFLMRRSGRLLAAFQPPVPVCGCDPPCDFVGIVDIAKRLGFHHQTVKGWRSSKALPEPGWIVSSQPAWNWPDIERWARKTGRLK